MITGLPPDTPVTTPLDAPTVASVGLLVLHVPPPVASLSDVVNAWQTVAVPVMDDGLGFTVKTVVDVAHPFPRLYVIVAVPLVTGQVTPVDEPTVATDVAELVKVPPAGVALSVVQVPMQVLPGPVMAPATGFTVTTAVALPPPHGDVST